MRFYLNVPFYEKEQAKALGARWDADRKQWYVSTGVRLSPLERWIDAPPSSELIAPIWLAQSRRRCWSCAKDTVAFALAAAALVDVYIDDDVLCDEFVSGGHDLFIADLEWVSADIEASLRLLAPSYYPDFSRTQGERLWMNHCVHCQVKQGDFYLHSEPGGAFCPTTPDEENQIRRTLLVEHGRFPFSGGFSLNA